jgi:Fe-S cluster assembly protein SufD
MTVIEAPVHGAGTWFDGTAPPARGDEAWRHTPVDDIVRRLAEVEPALVHAVPAGLVEELAGRHGGVQLVVVNGVPVRLADHADSLPAGVHIGAGDGGVRIEVAPRTEVLDVIHVVHVSKPEGRRVLARPRLAVSVGPSSRVELVESHVGFTGGALTEAVTSLDVGADAEVLHHRIQAEPDDAIHVGRVLVEQGAGSRLVGTSFATGASIARLAVDVVLGGDGASVDLAGLYAPRGSARHDTVVSIDHAASRATSSQVFRGAVADRAHGSFSGHVVVRPGTVATTAHQLNRNLLLAPTAQADSRPWLEIFADDVRCDHGSATGRLDEDALFYLRSRGIPLARARSMLVEAFVREVTARIAAPSLRAHVENLLGMDGAR